MKPAEAAEAAGARAWWWALAAVTVIVLAYATQNYFAQQVSLSLAAGVGRAGPPPLPWHEYVLRESPAWYAWLALSPAILRLSRRFPVLGPRLPRNLLVHACAGAVCAVVVMTVSQGVQALLLPRPGPLSFVQQVALGLVGYFLLLFSIYCSVVAVQHAALYYRAFQTRALHAARLEAQLSRARLEVLEMQLQPHFLFNAMNTVASLMTRDVAAARETLVRLGDLLRRALDSGGGHETALRDELAFLDRYVEIQRARFRDRLRVEVDVEPAALELAVPRLVLQPLVENAIRHGVQEQEGPCRVVVRGRRAEGRLRLEVTDDGPGLRRGEADADRPGIGLANTRARLAALYGADHRFEVADAEPRGVRVRLEIPARAAEPVAELVEG